MEGQTETVRIPLVIESWSATAVSAPPPQNRFVHHPGYFPGFKEAKRQANEFRRRAESRGRPPVSSITAPTSRLTATTRAAAAPGSAVILDGPSESDTNFIPPDPVLAAGPNNIVVLINSLIAIYDNSGNLQGGGFQQLATFFGGLGITGQIFDPRIIYDQTDNRFILTTAEVDLANFNNGHVFIAVSQTSDPTGAWNKYAVDFEGRNLSGTANTFPDSPTLGLSSSAVYVSTGQFELNANCKTTDSCSFSDTWIKVIGLPELLSGSAVLNITTFQDVKTATGFPAFAIEPALTYGSSSEQFLVAAAFNANPSSTLNVFSINTSGTPSLSAADLSVPAFSLPPDADQPYKAVKVATNDFRLLNAVWNNGLLWCAQNVGVGNAVVGWYELSAPSLSSVALKQSGTFSGLGDAYFPAVTATSSENAVIAFTTSSLLHAPSAAFTGRLAADSIGSTRPFVVYKQGTDSYVDFAVRWGDYNGASLDTDGATTWSIVEYAGSPDPHFGTSVAQISAPPALTISPPSLDFGTQNYGTTSALQTLTLTNSSAGSTTITNIHFPGGDFTLSSDQCSGVTLASGGSCALQVEFTPAHAGVQTEEISVTYSSPGSLVGTTTIRISGTTISGVMTLNPSSLTFPPTPVRTASTPLLVTVSNTGNGPMGVGPIDVPLGDYTQTNNCPLILVAGASCTINVTFRPTSLNSPTQILLDVGTTAPGGGLFITLMGTPTTAPAITPCPGSLTFQSQALGTSSSPQVATISNTGTAPLTIKALTVTGDFSQTNTCGALPVTLPARAACDLSVTFTPTATGSRTGVITITDDAAAGGTQTIALSGTGGAAASSLGTADPVLVAARAESLGGVGSAPPRAAVVQREIRDRRQLLEAFSRQPLRFEVNQGQTDARVKFLSRQDGYTVFLTSNGATVAFRQPATRSSVPARSDPRPHAAALLNMKLVGASTNSPPVAVGKLPVKTNYFIGNDPKKWRRNVASYQEVNYRNVYPGIDLVYHGRQSALEYDFAVSSGVDPRLIRLKFDGAQQLTLTRQGDLLIKTSGGMVRFRRPVAFQRGLGRYSRLRRHPRDARYSLRGHDEVGFSVGRYNRRLPLIIDPVLTYSTYLGGSGGDVAYAIAIDSAGSAYVTGVTSSPDFPTVNPFQAGLNSLVPLVTDVFVAKLNPTGAGLVYSTYLGGSDLNEGHAIAVDAAGNAYITGLTSSKDFPTVKPIQLSLSSGNDAFVAKLGPMGSSLVYSTFLGGSGEDSGFGIAVDSSSNAYVTGVTGSPDFPTTPGSVQPLTTNNRCQLNTDFCGDAFVTKLNAAGSAFVYSTHLGGSGDSRGQGIAVDAQGDAYVTGNTQALDFPVTPST